MHSLPAHEAQHHLDDLITQVTDDHAPVLLTGAQHEAVLVSKADWNAIQESLYLSRVPGLVESLQVAATEAIEDCVALEELDW